MNIVPKLRENPYIKADNESIAIRYKGQNHNVAIEDIANVYLKKTKRAYIPSFMNTIVSMYDKQYKLYIRTADSNEIKIKVKADERNHFLDLISYIRKTKDNYRTSVA